MACYKPVIMLLHSREKAPPYHTSFPTSRKASADVKNRFRGVGKLPRTRKTVSEASESFRGREKSFPRRRKAPAGVKNRFRDVGRLPQMRKTVPDVSETVFRILMKKEFYSFWNFRLTFKRLAVNETTFCASCTILRYTMLTFVLPVCP